MAAVYEDDDVFYTFESEEIVETLSGVAPSQLDNRPDQVVWSTSWDLEESSKLHIRSDSATDK